MTIIEAINRLDALKFNTYSQSEKVEWLSSLDRRIRKEIIDTHDGAPDTEFSGYDDDTPVSTELLVPAPYDEVYLRWMEAQIDYHNGEFGRYNNSVTMFNNAYSAYERSYNRTHMPLGNKLKFF